MFTPRGIGQVDMDGSYDGARPCRDLPLDCWQNILQHVDPPGLARAALVNRTCKDVSYDDRLWQSYFERDWSPECCVSPFCMCPIQLLLISAVHYITQSGGACFLEPLKPVVCVGTYTISNEQIAG
jgi:hypothetical protein